MKKTKKKVWKLPTVNKKAKGHFLPSSEVLYLLEDTSRFRPEEDINEESKSSSIKRAKLSSIRTRLNLRDSSVKKSVIDKISTKNANIRGRRVGAVNNESQKITIQKHEGHFPPTCTVDTCASSLVNHPAKVTCGNQVKNNINCHDYLHPKANKSKKNLTKCWETNRVNLLDIDTTKLKPQLSITQQSESERSAAFYLESKNCNSQSSPIRNNIFEENKTTDKPREGTVKVASVIHSPLKRINAFDSGMVNRKAKYERQATPICDAIMKEYAKRQKLLKIQGVAGPPDLSDLPIQELLRNTKKGNLNQNEDYPNKKYDGVTNVFYQKLNTSNNSKTTTKQEIKIVSENLIENQLHSKEMLEGSLSDINVNPAKNIEITNQSNKSDSENITFSRNIKETFLLNNRSSDIETSTSLHFQNQKPSIGKNYRRTCFGRKKQNYESQLSLASSHRYRTRNSRRSIECQKDSNSCENHIALPYEDNMETDTWVVDDQSSDQLKCNAAVIPKQKSVSLAERLTLIASKIADVIRTEPSLNIESEAESLLQTTQELVKLQKSFSFPPEKPLKLENDSLQIKEEVIEVLDHIPLSQVTNKQMNETQALNTNLGQFTISSTSQEIPFNLYVIKKEKSAQDLGIEVSQNMTHSKRTSSALDINSSLTPNDLSVFDKCIFIIEFFSSYLNVFDSQTLETTNLLSDTILLCIDHLIDSINQSERDEILLSEQKHIHNVPFSKHLYDNILVHFSKKLFPWFNLLIEKIVKNKISKALLITFIHYVAKKFSEKSPKHKLQPNQIRRVLLIMLRSQNYYHPLVWEILQSPDNVFNDEVKLVIQILNYFQIKELVSLPSGVLDYSFGETDDCTKKQLSTIISLFSESISDTLMYQRTSELTNKVPVNESKLSVTVAIPDQLIDSSCNNKLKSSYSRIFAQLLKTLELKEYNLKKIEEKLDQTLHALKENPNLILSMEQETKENYSADYISTSLQNMQENLNESINDQNKSMYENMSSTNSSIIPLTIENNSPLAHLLKEDLKYNVFFAFCANNTEKREISIKTNPEYIANNLKIETSDNLIIKEEPEYDFEDIQTVLPQSADFKTTPIKDPLMWHVPRINQDSLILGDSVSSLNFKNSDVSLDPLLIEPGNIPKEEKFETNL